MVQYQVKVQLHHMNRRISNMGRQLEALFGKLTSEASNTVGFALNECDGKVSEETVYSISSTASNESV